MYHTTGFTKDEIIDLCALIYASEENCDIDPWPPSLHWRSVECSAGRTGV
jgi:hypothetical protein